MSSNSSSAASSSGIGFTGLLTIVFIVLKLLHKIAWSWWWVLSPAWIAAAFVVLILLIVAAIAVATYRQGLTEYQDSRAFGDDDEREVEFCEVKKVPVTTYEYRKIGAGESRDGQPA